MDEKRRLAAIALLEDLDTAIELLRALVAMNPIERYEFSNMGSPDSINRCRFCYADDYAGGGLQPHKDTCLWEQARIFVS